MRAGLGARRPRPVVHAWLRDARGIAAEADGSTSDEQAFAVRSLLVHEWRKFLFRDPGLPRALLPAAWPGEQAAAFFDAASDRLLPRPGGSSSGASSRSDATPEV